MVIHHRDQAAELRENLHAESEQVLSDTSNCIAATQQRLGEYNTRITELKQAVWAHKPLALTPRGRGLPCDTPDIPIWRTARQSGRAFLLTKGEVTGYSEIEYVVEHQTEHVQDRQKALAAFSEFTYSFPRLPSGEPDLSAASAQDLRRLLELLVALRRESVLQLNSLHVVKGAVTAVSHGETRLNTIYSAETAESRSDALLSSATQP